MTLGGNNSLLKNDTVHVLKLGTPPTFVFGGSGHWRSRVELGLDLCFGFSFSSLFLLNFASLLSVNYFQK